MENKDIEKSLPAKLYKYRGFETEEKQKWVREILLENRFYFPTRSEFNDPYDCRLSPSWSASPEQWRTQMVDLWTAHPMLPPEFVGNPEGFVDELIRRGTVDLMEKSGDDAWQQLLDSFRILSLSENADEILMWSHYGGSNRGICLEFDTREKPISLAEPIEYQGSQPKVNAALADRNTGDKLLRTKASFWAYEKEWRIFTRQSKKYYRFPKESLSGVVFGCQITPEHTALIKEWLSKRQSPVKLYRAVPLKGEFSLKIQYVETIGPERHSQVFKNESNVCDV